MQVPQLPVVVVPMHWQVVVVVATQGPVPPPGHSQLGLQSPVPLVQLPVHGVVVVVLQTRGGFWYRSPLLHVVYVHWPGAVGQKVGGKQPQPLGGVLDVVVVVLVVDVDDVVDPSPVVVVAGGHSPQVVVVGTQPPVPLPGHSQAGLQSPVPLVQVPVQAGVVVVVVLLLVVDVVVGPVQALLSGGSHFKSSPAIHLHCPSHFRSFVVVVVLLPNSPGVVVVVVGSAPSGLSAIHVPYLVRSSFV